MNFFEKMFTFNHISLGIASMFGVICVLIIIFGLLRAIYLIVKQFISKKFNLDVVRLEFSLYLLLGLEFLIARDIIVSIVNETLQDLMQLGIIIILRITLSYFISKEVEGIQEHKHIQHLFLKRKSK